MAPCWQKADMLGIQYEVLFTDDLYEKIALHADKLAMDIRHAFESHHVSLLYDSITNQQYPILTDEELAAFSENTPSASGARQMHSIVQSVYVQLGYQRRTRQRTACRH